MKEPEFKNYKEKQKYFKQKSKMTNWLWISSDINYDKKNKNNIVKGRTYIKKEQESESE